MINFEWNLKLTPQKVFSLAGMVMVAVTESY
jgi:hypothetical protein